MNEELARKILGDWITEAGNLDSLTNYISWHKGGYEITMDGTFTIEQIEAITWWIKNKFL